MKRIHGARFWITCIGALCVFIAIPMALQAQGNGVVAGRVFDVAGNGVDWRGGQCRRYESVRRYG